MLAFVYLAYVGWPFISISDGASFFSPWIWTLASDIEVCSTKQVQAGKGINISARTFHLAQGDILKVCCPSPTGTISPKKKIKTVICPYLTSTFISNQIHDGKDNTAHVLGAFTGTSMLGLTLISTSNHLWLEFYSDPEATGEGFKLVYSSEFAAVSFRIRCYPAHVSGESRTAV